MSEVPLYTRCEYHVLEQEASGDAEEAVVLNTLTKGTVYYVRPTPYTLSLSRSCSCSLARWFSLNPNPYILPYTLHPKPYTLHTTPCTITLWVRRRLCSPLSPRAPSTS